MPASRSTSASREAKPCQSSSATEGKGDKRSARRRDATPTSHTCRSSATGWPALPSRGTRPARSNELLPVPEAAWSPVTRTGLRRSMARSSRSKSRPARRSGWATGSRTGWGSAGKAGAVHGRRVRIPPRGIQGGRDWGHGVAEGFASRVVQVDVGEARFRGDRQVPPEGDKRDISRHDVVQSLHYGVRVRRTVAPFLLEELVDEIRKSRRDPRIEAPGRRLKVGRDPQQGLPD